MAKGHMKCPRHGMKSTRPRNALSLNCQASPIHNNAPPLNMEEALVPAYFPQCAVPTLINDNCSKTIANALCFGTFADQHSGVKYNNLTVNFPFIPLIAEHMLSHNESLQG